MLLTASFLRVFLHSCTNFYIFWIFIIFSRERSAVLSDRAIAACIRTVAPSTLRTASGFPPKSVATLSSRWRSRGASTNQNAGRVTSPRYASCGARTHARRRHVRCTMRVRTCQWGRTSSKDCWTIRSTMTSHEMRPKNSLLRFTISQTLDRPWFAIWC